jgi:hypothetical protein
MSIGWETQEPVSSYRPPFALSTDLQTKLMWDSTVVVSPAPADLGTERWLPMNASCLSLRQRYQSSVAAVKVKPGLRPRCCGWGCMYSGQSC